MTLIQYQPPTGTLDNYCAECANIIKILSKDLDVAPDSGMSVLLGLVSKRRGCCLPAGVFGLEINVVHASSIQLSDASDYNSGYRQVPKERFGYILNAVRTFSGLSVNGHDPVQCCAYNGHRIVLNHLNGKETRSNTFTLIREIRSVHTNHANMLRT